MSQSDTGRAGVVHAPRDGNGMDKLASAILDDLLYNVIHDLIMKTHRDEKQARSATAAIRVETMAAEAAQDLAGATGESKPEGHYETDAASYENGAVTLKSNPLKTTHDILCPRCHLPRLLHPTDGRGARKPDPTITYCKKHPYIDKPGCDIYGQMWVAPGPGRGKKKKDFDKKVSAAIHAATTGIETTNGNGTTTEQRPPNVLSFPSATCSKCKRCILVSRLNNHMGSCIGNSGRNASRAAAAKISNGGSGSGLTDHTPPASQKGTPLPSSQGSPRKRDADDFDEDAYDESDVTGASGSQSAAGKPKKKLKASASASHAGSGGNTPAGAGASSASPGLSVALSKKLTLKMKGTAGSTASSPASSAAGSLKKQKPKASSALSFERKINDNYDDDDDVADGRSAAGDDDDYDDSRHGRHGYGSSNRHHGGGGGGGSVKMETDDGVDDDDDDDDGDVRSSIHFKAAASATSHGGSGGSGSTAGAAQKIKKKKLLVASSAAAGGAASSASSTPPKKTTKVPIPIPGKKLKLVNKTPLSPPAYKSGRRDADAVSESSGTMSSPRG